MITSILIDSREPENIQQLDFGVPVVVTKLDAGDCIISCKDGSILVIERKTPTDLLGSVRDGRLFSQCFKMRQISDWCYLVIVGELWRTRENKVKVDGHRETRWNYDSVQGSLLTVQETGVNVVYTADYKPAIERLAKRNREDLKIRPRRQSVPMTPDEALLAALPNIGPILAQQILAKCGNAAHALDWLTNMWAGYETKVPGIGSNQKAEIHSLFGLKDREYLTVNLWED